MGKAKRKAKVWEGYINKYTLKSFENSFFVTEISDKPLGEDHIKIRITIKKIK